MLAVRASIYCVTWGVEAESATVDPSFAMRPRERSASRDGRMVNILVVMVCTFVLYRFVHSAICNRQNCTELFILLSSVSCRYVQPNTV